MAGVARHARLMTVSVATAVASVITMQLIRNTILSPVDGVDRGCVDD